MRDEVTLDLQATNIFTQKARALEGNLFTAFGERMLKSIPFGVRFYYEH